MDNDMSFKYEYTFTDGSATILTNDLEKFWDFRDLDPGREHEWEKSEYSDPDFENEPIEEN